MGFQGGWTSWRGGGGAEPRERGGAERAKRTLTKMRSGEYRNRKNPKPSFPGGEKNIKGNSDFGKQSNKKNPCVQAQAEKLDKWSGCGFRGIMQKGQYAFS